MLSVRGILQGVIYHSLVGMWGVSSDGVWAHLHYWVFWCLHEGGYACCFRSMGVVLGLHGYDDVVLCNDMYSSVQLLSRRALVMCCASEFIVSFDMG